MIQLNQDKNRRILVIDDNRAIHDDFRKILSAGTAAAAALDETETALFGKPVNVVQKIRYEIDSAYQGQDGLLLVQRALAAGRPYALAFVDIRMPPGMDGVETTQKIWAVDPEIQIVLCTAYADYSWDEMFEKIGNCDGLLILKKPFDTMEALQLAQTLTEKWWLHQQSQRKVQELEFMVGERTGELQQTNEALQRQKTELRLLFDWMPAMVWFKDTENGILRVNKQAAETTGKPVAEIEGKSSSEIYPEEAAKFHADDLEVIHSGTPKLGIVEPFPDRNGNKLWVQTDKVPVFDQAGKVTGIVVMAQDITERKRAEEELSWKTAFLEAQVSSSIDGILVVDQQGRKILQNQRTTDLLKIPQHIADDEDDEKQLRWVTDTTRNPEQFVAKVLHLNSHPGEISRDEVELKDGTILDRYSAPVTGRDGKYYGRIWTFRDVTERRRAQEALQQSQKHLRDLIDGLGPSMFVGLMTPKGIMIECNRPALAAAGLKPEDVLGKPFAETYWWTHSQKIQQQLREAVARAGRGEASRYDVQIRVAENQFIDVDFSLQPVRDEAGEVVFIVPSGSVITERKQAETALRESDEKFHQLADNITDAFWIRSPDMRQVHYVSPAFARIWGRPVASLYADPHKWADFILPEDRERVVAAFAALIGDVPSLDINYRIRRPDGEIRWIHVRGFQVRDAEHKLIRHAGIATDITERKQAEISSLAFAKLGQHLSSATSAHEAFGIVNEVSKELFSWDAFWIHLYNAKSDLIYSGLEIDTIDGQPVAKVLEISCRPSDLSRRIMERGGELILRDDVATPLAGTIPFGNVTRPSASLMFVAIRSQDRPVGILSVQSYTLNAYNQRDLITLQTMADQCGGAFERIWAGEALLKSEAQLFQSQKMETVGKLAGGVAHEFNSILTAIIGQSELLLEDLPAGSPLVTNTTEIIKAASRAATLTRQLLAYGRKQFLQPEALNLNLVIAGMAGVLRHLMGEQAMDVKIVPAAGLQLVKADAGQIEQVIMNMAINARDAMPNGGKLTLETANVTFDLESVGRYPELKPGDYVMLAISDTGPGMSEEVKARLFEPFFSTKGVGQGTGLGLSTCYGIVKQSGGHISVYSETGRGTTFKIYLPQAEPPAKISPIRLDSPDLPRGTETILLVEDDPALREMAATLLRRLGYTVLTAINGVEAMSLSHQPDTGRIDLLFTDVVMPHMSGAELADRMRALYPHTRILFTSAYTENAIIHQGVMGKGVALLQKPFTPSALAHRLRDVLDQPK